MNADAEERVYLRFHRFMYNGGSKNSVKPAAMDDK